MSHGHVELSPKNVLLLPSWHRSAIASTMHFEMKASVFFPFFMVFSVAPCCRGFMTLLPSKKQSSTRFWSSGSNKDRESIMARNNARTCVKSFLTQRAIQSFMYLCETCRDPHSVRWMEEFLDLQNLLEYHGTGAFDIDRFTSWDDVLLQMMEKPKGEQKFEQFKVRVQVV